MRVLPILKSKLSSWFLAFSQVQHIMQKSFWPSLVKIPGGTLVPLPGIKPGPTARKALSPNHWTAREFPQNLLNIVRNLFEISSAQKNGCSHLPFLDSNCNVSQPPATPACFRLAPSIRTGISQSVLLLLILNPVGFVH